MSTRDRWIALAGVLGGIALAFVVIDGILLWQLSGEVSRTGIMRLAQGGIAVTGISAAASNFVQLSVRGRR